MCTAIDLSKGGGGLDRRFPEFHHHDFGDKELADLIDEVFGFGTVERPLEDRYNIRITDPLPVITNEGERKLEFYRFGLVPSWSKDAKIATRLFNARSETVAEKPYFRAAIRRRRCIVIATGFYEWPKYKKGEIKRPYRITMKDGMPFAIAGLWERWKSPNGEFLNTANIITTTPNKMIAEYHHRMPVILAPKNYDVWLKPDESDPTDFAELYRPFPAAKMSQYLVSNLINNPRIKTPETLEVFEKE